MSEAKCHEIPNLGWYFILGTTSEDSQVYYNGELVKYVQSIEVKLDLETHLTSVNLKILGASGTVQSDNVSVEEINCDIPK